MFARRDFLYKRHQNGPYRNFVARDTTSSLSPVSNEESIPSTSTTNAKTIASPTVLSTQGPQTTSTPTTASSSTTSSRSTSTTSSVLPSSSTSSTSTVSSDTSRTSSTASTPLTVASATAATHASSATTQAVTNISFTPTSSLSPSTTSSADSSSGTNTGAVIGGVAGALAGIAILGFLLMWCMRRQRSRDSDDFDAQAFKRQSAILVDDPVDSSRSFNPRPPTMIEHHNASPALAAQGGYGGQNFYGSFGGYGQQPPHAPPEMIQPTGSPPPQGYGAPPIGYTGYNDSQQHITRQPSNAGYAGYDSQQQLARQPSNAEYLTRQPGSATGYSPPGSTNPNAHYIDLNRSSVSPYQAAQYADISRQLGTSNPNGQAPHDPLELPDGPLPSPFDDSVGMTPAPDVTSPRVHVDHPSGAAASGPLAAASAPPTQEHATGHHQRPATVYEEGDAYGGI